MRLDRASSNAVHGHSAESTKYNPHPFYKIFTKDDDRVYVEFTQFGAGSEKFSDFVVSLNWSDVEGIIQTFADMGGVDAVRLQRAAKLGMAVEEFVKTSN